MNSIYSLRNSFLKYLQKNQQQENDKKRFSGKQLKLNWKKVIPDLGFNWNEFFLLIWKWFFMIETIDDDDEEWNQTQF